MYQLEEEKYLYLINIIPVLLLLFLYVQYWKRKRQHEFGDIALLNRLSPERSVFKSILKLVVFLLALMGLIIGLVNLKIGTKLETVKREGIDIVFAVDVSKSMLAEDVAPNRLEKSKQIVSQIINQLGNDRIGIVAYAGGAYPVLPITTDYSIAKMYLQSMNTDIISSQGTAIDEAIHLALTYYDNDQKINKLMVLISDGEDHSQVSEKAAQEANEMGLKIISIGVGTEKGGPIPIKNDNGVVENFLRDRNGEVVITKRNEDILKIIGNDTKGGYVEGNNTKEVLKYVKKVLNTIEKTEFESQHVVGFQSQFQWFLGIAFALLFIDIFFLERKTSWIKKMNLFNENR